MPMALSCSSILAFAPKLSVAPSVVPPNSEATNLNSLTPTSQLRQFWEARQEPCLIFRDDDVRSSQSFLQVDRFFIRIVHCDQLSAGADSGFKS